MIAAGADGINPGRRGQQREIIMQNRKDNGTPQANRQSPSKGNASAKGKGKNAAHTVAKGTICKQKSGDAV